MPRRHVLTLLVLCGAVVLLATAVPRLTSRPQAQPVAAVAPFAVAPVTELVRPDAGPVIRTYNSRLPEKLATAIRRHRNMSDADARVAESWNLKWFVARNGTGCLLGGMPSPSVQVGGRAWHQSIRVESASAPQSEPVVRDQNSVRGVLAFPLHLTLAVRGTGADKPILIDVTFEPELPAGWRDGKANEVPEAAAKVTWSIR